MVTFDAQDPGTPAARWRADPRWRSVPGLSLDGVRNVIVLAAHPDDETLGAGGLIATARAVGLPVTVVVVTDGAPEAATDAAVVADVRRGEAADAARALGVDDLRFLGFTDGAVREEREAITAAVVAIVAEQPDALLLAPWSGDGHRDHRVLGEIASEVAGSSSLTLWSYPIWLWHWGDPQHPGVPWSDFRVLGLRESARRAKARALARYESQTGGARPMLHARFLEHFASAAEFFVVAESEEGPALVPRSRATGVERQP